MARLQPKASEPFDCTGGRHFVPEADAPLVHVDLIPFALPSALEPYPAGRKQKLTGVLVVARPLVKDGSSADCGVTGERKLLFHRENPG